MAIAGANYREGIAFSPDGAMYVTPSGSSVISGGTIDNAVIGGTTPAAITGTTITANTAFAVDDATSARQSAANLGVEYTYAQSAVPFIWLSSGSMGNNGALSGVTALSRTYSEGAWVLLPANAIAAGTPAAPAWYWCVFSSTTAGTVYNSTYTSGVPGLGTQTAFSTTGPGAFTGVTANTIGPAIQISANAIGPNGSLIFEYGAGSPTNNGNNKILSVYFHTSNAIGGTQVSQATMTTVSLGFTGVIQNRGATNVQVKTPLAAAQISASDGVVNANSTIDTTAATWLVLPASHATATDNVVLERFAIRIRYGA